jgi:C-terminal processing protease CtpA/Prc
MQKSKNSFGIVMVALLAIILCTSSVFAHFPEDQAYMGVYTKNLDKLLLEALDFDQEGILIEKVIDDSPAMKAGLEEGDIILQLGDAKITSTKELIKALHEMKPDDKVALKLWRKGKAVKKDIVLGAKEDKFAGYSMMYPNFHKSKRGSAGAKSIFITTDGDTKEVEKKIELIMSTLDEDSLKIMTITNGDTTISYSGSRTCEPRGFLGVEIEDINRHLKSQLKLKDGSGVLVKKVVEESAAEKAGLEDGDILIEIAGEPIKKSCNVFEVIGNHKPGDVVDVVVMRDGKKKTFKATLDEQKCSDHRNSFFYEFGNKKHDFIDVEKFFDGGHQVHMYGDALEKYFVNIGCDCDKCEDSEDCDDCEVCEGCESSTVEEIIIAK